MYMFGREFDDWPSEAIRLLFGSSQGNTTNKCLLFFAY